MHSMTLLIASRGGILAMRFHLRHWRALFCVLISLTLGTASSQAAQHVVTGQQSMTVGLTGGLAALLDSDGDVYTADPYGIGESFALLVVLDTGASGCLLSQTNAGPGELNIPITGETYEDVGIGGTEMFHVSESTGLMLAPIGIMAIDPLSSYDPSEDITNYSHYGDYNFQIRQSDPTYLGYYPIGVNIIGTPVLNNYVMHVTPNSSGYTTMIPTIDYLNTELLNEMPGDLPSSDVFRISLTYQDFVGEGFPVTTSTNPVIENIKLTLGDQEHTSTWLFDTGGSVSIIGREMATSLGIDLVDDPIADFIIVTGVGGEDRLLLGYLMDSLTVPLIGGDELMFEDIVIFVPEEGALPADLTGIFGMNLLNQSFAESDIFTLQNSPFSDWYVDPFNCEVVLVLGDSSVPEPGTFVLLAFGASIFLLRRIVRRRSA
jgi:hypothetical protein